MSSEVAPDWPSVALGELARVKRGASPRPIKDPKWFSDEGHGWVRIADVTASDRVLLQTTQYLSDAGKAASVEIVPGDLIMSICGTIGRPLFSGIYACIHDGFVVFRDIEKTQIDPDYLYFFLQAHSRHFEAQSQPGTQRNLNSALVGKTEMPLPPLDEQRRIAEVLRSVDEAIAANAALLDGVKGTKQGTMEAVLSGGFDEVRLETLLADTRYPMRSGPFGSALLKSELQTDGIPFLGIDNVHVERFVPIYRRFLSDKKYRELSRYTVYPGDVMVTIMGTVGRCCVVPPDVGTSISSKHVWTLTIDHDRYSPALLAWQINHSPAVLEQLQGSAQGGIMSAISSVTLRDLLVPLPSPAEVRDIENLLLAFNAQIAALEAEQDAACSVKAALMSDLLSGCVRVPA